MNRTQLMTLGENLLEKNGIEPSSFYSKEGQNLILAIKESDKCQDDGKGYFEELIRIVQDLELPVVFTINNIRKSLEGGCNEALSLRNIPINYRGVYNGELKTLGRGSGKQSSNDIYVGHLNSAYQMNMKALADLYEVGKSQLKYPSKDLNHTANGLMNPLFGLINDSNKKISHVFDNTDKAFYESGVVSTNAGSREASMFFNPEELAQRLIQLQKKGKTHQNEFKIYNIS